MLNKYRCTFNAFVYLDFWLEYLIRYMLKIIYRLLSRNDKPGKKQSNITMLFMIFIIIYFALYQYYTILAKIAIQTI